MSRGEGRRGVYGGWRCRRKSQDVVTSETAGRRASGVAEELVYSAGCYAHPRSRLDAHSLSRGDCMWLRAWYSLSRLPMLIVVGSAIPGYGLLVHGTGVGRRILGPDLGSGRQGQTMAVALGVNRIPISFALQDRRIPHVNTLWVLLPDPSPVTALAEQLRQPLQIHLVYLVEAVRDGAVHVDDGYNSPA